jgi:hypothetical protein
VDGFITGKKTAFKGVGPDMLRKFHERAKLNTKKGAAPYLTAPVSLPHAETELFFDIEVDPMRDLCYLHGFVERRGGENSTEKYVAFFTDAVSAEEEERAFAEAWGYIGANQPGVPPLKWSTHWDRFIPFQEEQRWQASETSPKRSY